MPYRKTPLANREYYHVFNRGVAKLPIFTTTKDYKRFIQTMQYYTFYDREKRFSLYSPQQEEVLKGPKIITFISYCLMPNHFHFLLRQEKENGISNFMRKLGNSYTRYFNIKYNRVGPLLQGQFKAVRIETNEQLVHVSRYIHLNPVVGFVTKSLENYPWSSYEAYTNLKISSFCEKEVILGQFKSQDKYKQFVLEQENYGKKLHLIKHQLLDFED